MIVVLVLLAAAVIYINKYLPGSCFDDKPPIINIRIDKENRSKIYFGPTKDDWVIVGTLLDGKFQVIYQDHTPIESIIYLGGYTYKILKGKSIWYFEVGPTEKDICLYPVVQN